jgi:hypothetical protein
VCEYTSPGSVRFRMTATTERRTLVLGVRPVRSREWQPFLALHFSLTKSHPRTRTVPVNGGNLDIVLARDHSRVLRITRDGIEGLAGCIENY